MSVFTFQQYDDIININDGFYDEIMSLEDV